MTRTKHVQGTLTPTKIEAVNENTRDKILAAANQHGFGLVITDARSNGVIDINSLTPALGSSTSIYGVLTVLSNFLYAEGVKELGLEGTLTVSVITPTSPVVINIEVEPNGRISYNRPHSHWMSNTQPQLVETVAVEPVVLIDVSTESIADVKVGINVSV
jgi:hypothetical protein